MRVGPDLRVAGALTGRVLRRPESRWTYRVAHRRGAARTRWSHRFTCDAVREVGGIGCTRRVRDLAGPSLVGRLASLGAHAQHSDSDGSGDARVLDDLASDRTVDGAPSRTLGGPDSERRLVDGARRSRSTGCARAAAARASDRALPRRWHVLSGDRFAERYRNTS